MSLFVLMSMFQKITYYHFKQNKGVRRTSVVLTIIRANLFWKKRKINIFINQTFLYVCPNNQELTYRTTTRDGYREYKSDSKKCQNCPLLSQCTRSKNKVKVVTRHVWEEHKEKVRLNSLSKSGKMLYKFRKEKIERSFADSGRAARASLLPVKGVEECK